MKVELVDSMGSDASVTNAARVSFAKEASGYTPEANAKLIKFLAEHNHWTPFAHTTVTLRVAAPVPIRTQCFKHKQGLVENEESRRYISSTPTVYIPDNFRSKPEGSIKQGSAEEHPNSEFWKVAYEMRCTSAVEVYTAMIEDGVCPEQARFILPQGAVVNWVWTGNIYAFANFVKKRTDPTAQAEVAELARLVDTIIRPLYPVAWAALVGEEV